MVHHTAITEGTVLETDLCDECFAKFGAPGYQDVTAAAFSAHCRYCGGKLIQGSEEPNHSMAGINWTKFICGPCYQKHCH